MFYSVAVIERRGAGALRGRGLKGESVNGGAAESSG